MIKLLEPGLLIKCRKEDVELIKGLKNDCESEYEQIMMEETKNEYKCILTIVESEFLTTEQGGDCGGIVLYSQDRKIVCPNTLMNRLDLCFEELLPVIRKQLFPTRKWLKASHYYFI